ncbi:MAG TPA: response regulator transcription factor [Candidatus Tectomicrobia bacterium]|nr:response regulator transcription factor [Candidatus Tectomicrobia bacterium]
MTRNRAAVSVGVVDDDAIVRAWVRHSLAGTEFRVAGEAATASEALDMVERRRPDVLVVDLNLPDQAGTAVVQALRRRSSMAPALVITAVPRRGLNETVREAGAQGVIQKQADPGELLRALREVVAGNVVVDHRHPRRPSGQAALSPREREVLALAASGATNVEIAARLGVSRQTVKTLLGRAFAKLGAGNRIEAVAAARELGILP